MLLTASPRAPFSQTAVWLKTPDNLSSSHNGTLKTVTAEDMWKWIPLCINTTWISITSKTCSASVR